VLLYAAQLKSRGIQLELTPSDESHDERSRIAIAKMPTGGITFRGAREKVDVASKKCVTTSEILGADQTEQMRKAVLASPPLIALSFATSTLAQPLPCLVSAYNQYLWQE
jgi:hypothetical protein